MGYAWQTALGAVFVSGLLFVVISLAGLRGLTIRAIPNALKHGTAAGIGLFITFIGLTSGGIIVASEATFVHLGDVSRPAVLLAIAGIIFIAGLMALRVRGAILYGILGLWVVGLITGQASYGGIVGPIPSLAPTFLQLDIAGALTLGAITIIFAFVFVDLFDTVGTLVGVTQQAGLLRPDGSLPRSREALLADASGTVAGSHLGTSTVTSYIESAAGISEGGRTGLTALTTAGLFLIALFFTPLAISIPAFATAPALIIVGSLMIKSILRIDWEDASEALPAFVVLVFMPFTYSIATGIAAGFVVYPLVKAIAGRVREVHWFVWLLFVIFVARFIWLGSL
jgi:AGZA family xanthine/uracil permease-like MFS transporter